MTGSSDVCGGGSIPDDSSASGPECEHAFLDEDSVTGMQVNPTLVFQKGNTWLRIATSPSSAREPRAR